MYGGGNQRIDRPLRGPLWANLLEHLAAEDSRERALRWRTRLFGGECVGVLWVWMLLEISGARGFRLHSFLPVFSGSHGQFLPSTPSPQVVLSALVSLSQKNLSMALLQEPEIE